jgi:predicted MFS family arabinose efflux permease
VKAITGSERKLIFLLAAVQFVNVLDFMMVMPLGPDFATALGIPTSRLGLVGGIYTASAAVSGLVGALFLDRFDRRSVLGLAMLGLCLGTVSGGLVDSFEGLLVARVLAGAFGGPATATALAILSDNIPPERRGRAMGAVMGAFSVASVLGVPAGLELAHIGGWRLPFFAVGAMGLLVGAAAWAVMPPQQRHLTPASGPRVPTRPLADFLADPLVRLSLLATVVTFMGAFALIPHLASFFLFNLDLPRDRLSGLYLLGGVVSFVAMRLAGRLVDRRGPMPAIVFGASLLVGLLAVGFLPARTPVPAVVLFVGFMLANSVRMVGLQTLTSKVPPPQERARFMSAQSGVHHIGAAVGAMASAAILVERPDHSLGRVPLLASFVMALSAALPFVVQAILRRQRDVAPPPATISSMSP